MLKSRNQADRLPTRADLIAAVARILLDYQSNPVRVEPYLSNRAESIVRAVEAHLEKLHEEARLRWARGDWSRP